MRKSMMSAMLALSLVVVVSGTTSAAPSNATTSLKQVQDQRQELEIKVEMLDSQIVHMMQEIDKNKESIDKVGKDIAKAQSDLNVAEKNIKGQQDLFNKRVRAMYISGVDSYLNVVLDSDNLSDLVSRVETVKRIVGYDNDIISNLKEKKSEIADKKKELDSQNNKLVALKTENEKKLSKLNNDKADESKVIASLKEKENTLAVKDTATIKLVASAENEVKQVRVSAPRISRGTSSVSSVPASSDSIVAYASNFMGTPYQWGGNGPRTFDCSGFTSYVFAHFGVSLPRVASDQQGTGTSVSRDQLQPGDLVFFGSPAHHVGIYVGNGCYIHAPKTGDVVKISPVDRSDYSGARRVR